MVLPIEGQDVTFRVRFSPNGVWFNDSVSTSTHPSNDSVHGVENFTYPARFIQVLNKVS